MSLGLQSKLNVLQHSPHDCESHPGLADPIGASGDQHWVASRYTIRATADDGRLVLWNTLSGKITAIQAEDRERVIALLSRIGFVGPKTGVVGYLVDRGYLIRKGVDEYRKFQHLFGQQHYRNDVLELIVMASEDCNFRCTYCYEDFRHGTMLPAVREGIKNLVRQRIKKLGRLYVSWFGGEPLYGWEAVEDLAPFFLEIAAEHEVPYRSSHMTTNGYLLTPEVADKLLSWRINNFQVTLDGLAEHHNHSRPGRDGSPTFDRILENLRSLAAREDPFHVLLRVNVDRNNAGGLSQFLDLLADQFAGDPRFTLGFRMVGKWGGTNDAQLDVCTGDESENIRLDMTAQAIRQGFKLESIKDIARLGSQVCYAARPFNFLIGATGKVMKCTVALDKDESNVVGRITPEGRLELNDERMSVWTEPAFEKDTQCQKCVVLPTCSGISCPLVRIESGHRSCIGPRLKAKSQLMGILDSPNVVGRAARAGI